MDRRRIRHAKVVVDLAAGEMLYMQARLGDADTLQA
jgi:hypothetical protein